MSKNTRTRILLTAVAALLLVTMAVGGTMAWLVDNTEAVKNEFTTSKVGVDLTETKVEEYKMIPGYTITKDPMVKLTAGSEDSYVFVEVTKSANFDTYMTFETEWTPLTGVEGVYYTTMTANDEARNFLKGNQVTVKNTVTNAQMEAAATNPPTLTFKAYAVQMNYTNGTQFTPAQAWSAVKDEANTTQVISYNFPNP